MTATATALDKIKILYIHGMEAGPNDVKYKALNAEFKNIYAPNMQVSMTRLQTNSILCNIFKQSSLIWSTLVSVLIFGAMQYYDSNKYIKYGFVVSCLLSLIYFRKKLLSNAVKKSMETCIEMEYGAIKHYKPDLIIGASWGGFITMRLIQSGLWNGKTILMAPAYNQCMRWINYEQSKAKLNELMTIKNELKNKILIVHANNDKMVNCDDSNLLCSLNKNYMDLKIIQNDNHLFSKISKSGEFVTVVKQYLSSANS